MKFILQKIRKCEIEDIIVVSVVAAVIIGIGIIFATVIGNANNRITEGTIIDKHYRAAYYGNTTIVKSENAVYANNPYHPARYSFTICGEKNGETVEYTFDVTETQYNSYNIGDYFKL